MRSMARPAAWLALLLAVSTAVGTGASPAAAGPPYTTDERARAIASPSLVYLETVYTGYLRNKATNVPLLADPVVYNRRCSGFVVNSDGTVATTRVCVQPPEATILQQALYVAGYLLIGEKKLDPTQLRGFVDSNMNTSVFTGMSENTAPAAQLFGQLNVAKGALVDKPAIPGRVLGGSDLDQGNVAVVKLSQGNLPAVELQPKTNLDQGAQVLTLGFTTTDSDERIGTYTLQSRSVQVVGQGSRGKAPFYKISDKLGTYAHGGMAIDNDGRVVGMIDEDPALPNNENRVIAKASNVSALLTKLGLANTLGANDQLYRTGLDSYFKGRYSRAINQLDQTARNVPTNLVAQTYRGLATDRRRIEGEPSGLPTWVLPTATGAGAALVAGVLGLLIGRRRGRRRSRRSDPSTPTPGRYPSSLPAYQDPYAAPLPAVGYQSGPYQPTPGPDRATIFPPPPPVWDQPPPVSSPPWSVPLPPEPQPPVSPHPVPAQPVSSTPVSSHPAPRDPDPWTQAQTQQTQWPSIPPTPPNQTTPPNQPMPPNPPVHQQWAPAPQVQPTWPPPPWPPDQTTPDPAAEGPPPSTPNGPRAT